MGIKKLSADQDFQSVINNINDYLKKINDYQVNHQSEFGLPIEELGQFRKSWFYNNWQARFRKIQAFNGLGLTGVINTPNTTFEEWLWWFHEWAESFMYDYNKFKELMFQALLVIEKHLEAVDTELQDHEERITDNTNRLDGDDVKLNEHEQRLDGLDRDLAKEVQDRINGDNAEKNARIIKDNDLQNQINAEKGAREQKVNDLQNQINTETQARKDADNTEKTAREQGDNNLGNRITVVDNKVNNISKVVLSYENTYNLDRSKIQIMNGLQGEGVNIGSWSSNWFNSGFNPMGWVGSTYEPLDVDGDGDAEYFRVQISVMWMGWENHKINDFPTEFANTGSPSHEIAVFDFGEFGNFADTDISKTGTIFGHYRNLDGTQNVTRTGFYSWHVVDNKIHFGLNYVDEYSSDWRSSIYFNGSATLFLKKV